MLIKKVFIKGKPLRIGLFTPVKLIINPPASSALGNFDFVQLHTELFYQSIILLFLVLTTLVFLLFVFLLHFK